MNLPSGTLKFYCTVMTPTELGEACEEIGKDKEGCGRHEKGVKVKQGE